MPGKPKYAQELEKVGVLHANQLENLRRELTDLGQKVDALSGAKADGVRDARAELRQQAGELRQQFVALTNRLDEQAKRADEWDKRRWGLLVLLIGAVLSLASGLIVVLSRRGP